MSKIDKHFVSDIDRKMAQFNATHPLSAEQKAEQDKYRRIYHLRDIPTQHHATEDELWK